MMWFYPAPRRVLLNTVVLLAMAVGTYSHISLWYPGPLGGAKEANAFSIKPDPLLNFPLGCCDESGAPTLADPGPCRGHLDLFGKEEPQVVWEAGQDAYFRLSTFTYSPGAPGSTHNGGSCQVGFSIDGGTTWKAAASFFGNCPHRGTDGSPEAQTFHFTVPKGMPSGDALFLWLWLNREHEANVNCAKVRIASEQGVASVSHMRAIASPSQSTLGVQPKTGDPKGTHSDACEWASAPAMQTSYFTRDAKCMPGAKLSKPKSDTFEYAWDVPCGVVGGDSAYPIHIMDCNGHN